MPEVSEGSKGESMVLVQCVIALDWLCLGCPRSHEQHIPQARRESGWSPVAFNRTLRMWPKHSLALRGLKCRPPCCELRLLLWALEKRLAAVLLRLLPLRWSDRWNITQIFTEMHFVTIHPVLVRVEGHPKNDLGQADTSGLGVLDAVRTNLGSRLARDGKIWWEPEKAVWRLVGQQRKVASYSIQRRCKTFLPTLVALPGAFLPSSNLAPPCYVLVERCACALPYRRTHCPRQLGSSFCSTRRRLRSERWSRLWWRWGQPAAQLVVACVHPSSVLFPAHSCVGSLAFFCYAARSPESLRRYP